MSTELNGVQARDRACEQLSALMDGEVERAACAAPMGAIARDPGLLEDWADYQRIGDVMRGGAALAGSGNELAFLAAFRERLAAEPDVQTVVADNVLPLNTPSVPVQRAEPAPRSAANDGIYRWKMVAGLATVMAVLVVGWAALDESSLAPATPAPQEIALQQPSAPAPQLAAGGGASGSLAGDAAIRQVSASVAGAGSAVALLPQGSLRRISQPGLVVEREAVGSVASRYALRPPTTAAWRA